MKISKVIISTAALVLITIAVILYNIISQNKDIKVNNIINEGVNTVNQSALEMKTTGNSSASSIIQNTPEEQTVNVEKSGTITISDTTNWKHPVKDLLNKLGIKIKKVEFLKNNTYPVFYLENSQYTTSIVNDYKYLRDIAESNEFLDYKLIYENEKERVSVEVLCERELKRLIKAVVINEVLIPGKENAYINLKEYIVAPVVKNVLNEQDFIVNYNDFKISKSMNINDFFNKFGYGTANATNNYGYVGEGPDGMHRNQYGYPAEKPMFFLNIMRKQPYDEFCKIESILLETTERGISIGNKYENLLEKYNEPNFTILSSPDDINKYRTCIYSYEDKQLLFSIDNKMMITSIIMQLENLYKY